VKRFWSKVKKTDGCWEWQACKVQGYGRFNVDRKSMLAHRYVLTLYGITIPSGMHVCHHCDNPGCVNPDHLFIGDDAANHRDMVMKGRSTRGERNPRAVLTENDVRKIKMLAHLGARTGELACKFGVWPAAISKIRHGQRWGHVDY